MQTASGPGMLLLGLGESSRSFVLLAAVILALESRRKIAFLILLSLVPASLMLAGGLLIQGAFSDSIQGLLFGGLAYLVCFAFAVGLLMPATCIWGYNRVRIAFRGRGD
jgi:putative peptidoglycan lipid II flippase